MQHRASACSNFFSVPDAHLRSTPLWCHDLPHDDSKGRARPRAVSAPGGLEVRSPGLIQLRDEWFAHALSTAPADRPAAEEAVAQLYGATGRPPPRFIWVRSPAEAAKVLPAKEVFRFTGEWQTAEAQIAALAADLRHRMSQRTGWHRKIREPLEFLGLRVRQGLLPAVKSTMPASLGLSWSGQHEAPWQAEFDMHERVYGVRYDRTDRELFELWKTLTRSTGWWWPRDDVCVMAERPVAIHLDEDSLLHNDKGPALAFADGSVAHAWRGALVPRWVIEEPTGARILAERNVEVRRCAIERIGWERFVDDARLTLLGTAPDPGNPGFELKLYDLPAERVRLLLAVNGSVERDGTRRRYGLRVPDWFTDPVDAAGWSYGLTGAQYSQLQRRT